MSVLDSVSHPNPWLHLNIGCPPYCAPTDRPCIEAHNARLAPHDDRRVHTDVYPEPYIGDPDAPVMLLLANPGYDETARAAHSTSEVGKLCLANLQHRRSDYPFYPLKPEYGSQGGSPWWSQSLRYWIAKYGAETVARTFFCVEVFPYASRRYAPLLQPVPSQAYSIAIAREKLRRGCTTVVVRKHAAWRLILPELQTTTYFQVINPQSKSLSPAHAGARGNLPPHAAAALHRVFRTEQPGPTVR